MRQYRRDTRERVLGEAARAFRAQGPERVSVQDIMRGVGLTHGGFYAHFKSKDDLLCQAVERMFDEALARWQGTVAGLSPADGLASYIRVYLAPLHARRTESGCPIAALASDQVRMPPAARAAFAAGVQRLRRAIAAHLRKMGHARPLPLATSVLGELAGAMVLARTATDDKQSSQMLRASRSQLASRLRLSA